MSYIFKFRLPLLVSFFLIYCFSEVLAKSDKHSAIFSKEPTTNSFTEIIDIRFPQFSDSSSLENVYIMRGRYNTFYVTIPEPLDSTLVEIEIISGKNKSVKINGLEVEGLLSVVDGQELLVSSAKIDISQNTLVEIFNESGKASAYDVLVKSGIKQLDSIVYEFKERYNIPGISFAIANLEKTSTVYNAGFGYAIKEEKTRVRPDHLFRLASMSKQHTAIAILKLIEEGKIAINDTVFGVNGILKDQFDDVPERASRITVRNLLEHTSGYRTHPDYMFDQPYYGWTMRERIQAMLKSRQPNEPGTVFAYYNTGYGILGYIVESVTGKTFEGYLSELYASVGVDDIHVGGAQDERRPNEVAYYSQNGSSAEGVDMEIRGPAGGLIASTEQLIKLLWTLDGSPTVPDILNCHTRDMMFTPSEIGRSRYSLGWRTNHEYFPYSFYHGGTLAGVSTFWVYSHGYAVIFLCNSRNSSRQFDNELYRMAREVIDRVVELNL